MQNSILKRIILSEKNFIINNNNKVAPEFKIKSGGVLFIIGELNETKDTVFFFVNNIPMIV